MHSAPSHSRENLGMLLGLIGVAGFSGTLPATRLAVAELDPTLVGLGRSVVAALFAAVLLLLLRQRLPSRHQIRSLFIVAAGVVIGFPILSAWALQQLPASHGAIVVAVLPLLTALAGSLRSQMRPSPGFWLTSLASCAAVLGFSISSGNGGLQAADLILLASVAAGAIGYAEGGELAKEMGGWQVICWALVLTAPLLILPVGIAAWQHGFSASDEAWSGFVYVSLISQLIGFFLWYQGLALGGVVRVSQVQYLQPFMTLTIAAMVLGEPVTPSMLSIAAFIVIMVALGKRMPVVAAKPA
ncbi:MAG: DMT family transporter [Sideroxydans sp.]|nr:DMT family transporter [Sideroxydans sp.]